MPPRHLESEEEKTFLVAFGQHIRELRKSKKWSQDELAFQAGLDRTYISGVERGERNISLVNIYRLLKSLDSEPLRLFFT
jgi:transcriptional regulator with XRE-family HTH domain